MFSLIKMQKRHLSIILLSGLLLTACQSSQSNTGSATQAAPQVSQQELTQTAAPADTPTVQPTPTTEEVIDPLTGLPVADPALLQRRPVMVKVSNYPHMEGRTPVSPMRISCSNITSVRE
jgi:hypothetical protein